ncbi:MAG: hypothetical protein ACKN81_18980 [Pirellulaceae bacterium]
MSVIEPSSSSPSDVREYDLLRTSKVDLVSSMLLSLVLMIGLAVAMMGAIYFLHNYKWGPEKIVLEPERVAGRGDHAAGFARDLEPPGAEEVEEISEPSLEQTLEAVTETLSTMLASLDSLDTSALAASPGTGQGDSRPPGPLGEGDDIEHVQKSSFALIVLPCYIGNANQICLSPRRATAAHRKPRLIPIQVIVVL